MRLIGALTFCLLCLCALCWADDDPRTRYDVQTYRLDLRVDPASETLSGIVGIEAKVTADSLDTLELDLMPGRAVFGVNAVEHALAPDGTLDGPALQFSHTGGKLSVTLAKALKKGDEVRVAVTYTYHPEASERRTGIRFAKTPDGKPWITTSCQNLGAQSWWPCKSETVHPEDKHDRIFINATVPKGLIAVSNGRLWKTSVPEKGWETFHWRHDYPCEAYSVTLDVAPYVSFGGTMKLPGLEKPLSYSYYVLPQDLEKAKLQFADAPRMLQIYSEMFGPFPFPNSKFCLVEVPFWGMEHSTAVAYGNSFPAWLKVHGGPDKYADFNRLFDYILIHECAHEWWGNAVSAQDWGHFWVHEGLATYTEGVYVEKTRGRDEADKYFAAMMPKIDAKTPIARADHPAAGLAYNNNIYYKGACVLNMLRHFVNNDAAWWKSIRDFQLKYRYKNAKTEDFQAILEANTGLVLQPFFLEFFYGKGIPALKGTVSSAGKTISVDVENPEQEGIGFHVPIDLQWQEGGQTKSKRVMLNPGSNHVSVECGEEPKSLKVVHLDRVFGKHEVGIR